MKNEDRDMTLLEFYKESLEKVNSGNNNKSKSRQGNMEIAIAAMINIDCYPDYDIHSLRRIAHGIDQLIGKLDFGKDSKLVGFLISQIFELQMLLQKNGIDHNQA